MMGATLFTVGYEGLTVEGLIQALKENGVSRLVDVRESPRSRKAGFSSRKLESHLEGNGIQYIHIRDLGSPKNLRDNYRMDGDFRSFSLEFERLLASRTNEMERVARLASEKTTALMCYEADHSTCHRSIIANRLAGMGFEIRNISPVHVASVCEGSKSP